MHWAATYAHRHTCKILQVCLCTCPLVHAAPCGALICYLWLSLGKSVHCSPSFFFLKAMGKMDLLEVSVSDPHDGKSTSEHLEREMNMYIYAALRSLSLLT